MSDPTTATSTAPPRDAEPSPLLPRVAAGEAAAVRQCLDRYTGLVWSLAHRTLGAGPDAEDAVQDIFVELWQKADRYDPAQGKEATYVAVIARRRVIDRLRRRTVRPDHRAKPLAAAESMDHDGVAGDPTVPAELADEIRRIEAALADLKPEQQQALRLAVAEGLTHQETAERMDLPLGTVKTWVRRGLIHLRDALSQPGEVPS